MRSIPFLDRFELPILSRLKVYTARTKPCGKPGEVLQSPFCPIEILDLSERSLGWIRDNLWQWEGVSGPDDFEITWRSLHNGEFDSERKVWLHHFRVYEPEVWV